MAMRTKENINLTRRQSTKRTVQLAAWFWICTYRTKISSRIKIARVDVLAVAVSSASTARVLDLVTVRATELSAQQGYADPGTDGKGIHEKKEEDRR